jgi:diaminopimelate epimerase
MMFWKMQGLGNDYIVIDNRENTISDAELADIAKRLCLRRFSVGADGLLVVCDSKVADVKMRIFNSDGSEAEMCGNGIRCFSRYCYEMGVVALPEFLVETLAGLKSVCLTVEEGEVVGVRVDMGKPNWDRRSLPMIGEGNYVDQPLKVGEEEFRVTCLSMGNPHCVIFVNNVDDYPVQRVGLAIENDKAFPNRTNVGFIQVLNQGEVKVRVWERGCGETLACGTGACAAVAVANRLNKVGDSVEAHLLGGDLHVDVSENIMMTGPAEKVFEGRTF